MIARTALAAALVPFAASAEIIEAEYLCEGSVTLSALYLTERNPQIVVIDGDGVLAALRAVPAASGARYEGAPGQGGYVWWSKGDEATLYWADGETGIEEPFLAGCIALAADRPGQD